MVEHHHPWGLYYWLKTKATRCGTHPHDLWLHFAVPSEPLMKSTRTCLKATCSFGEKSKWIMDSRNYQHIQSHPRPWNGKNWLKPKKNEPGNFYLCPPKVPWSSDVNCWTRYILPDACNDEYSNMDIFSHEWRKLAGKNCVKSFKKCFFVELVFEYFTGGNILWVFHCLLVFGWGLNSYI